MIYMQDKRVYLTFKLTFLVSLCKIKKISLTFQLTLSL